MSLIRKVSNNLLSSSNLSDLSLRLHLVITAILLIQNIPVTIYRYMHYPFHLTLINLTEISIYVIAIGFYYINKLLLSLITTALGIPILYAYITYIQPIAPIDRVYLSSFWFLLSFMLIYSILIRKNKFRISYIIFVFTIYFIPGCIVAYNYPGDLIKLIQLSTLTLIPLIISAFIENQDSRIINLNQNLKQRLQEKEKLTQQVKVKNEELITFSHIMGHDLKAPIRTINSFTQLLRKKIKFEERKDEEYFQFIEDSSKRMKTLIDDLMTFYKIDAEENTIEKINIHQLLHKIKTNYQFDIDNRRLILDFDNLVEINGYRNLLRTLFYNLISNSIKYQPKNKVDHIPHIKISASKNKTHINVFVSDNGIGIDDSYLLKLFTPFQRFHNHKDYQGTGLGMSICKRVMDKHEGQITVENTSEKGTTFKLTFSRNFGKNLLVSS